MDIRIERQGSKAVVHLAGRVDYQNNLSFQKAVKPLFAEGDVEKIEIDFNHVSYIDSLGLGSLLLLRQQSQQAKKLLALSNCGADLKKVLFTASFDQMFSINE